MIGAPSGAERTELELVKAHALSTGVRLTTAAYERLSNGGAQPLSVHEYPTTGGVTLVLDHGVYVNAPFDEWYCADAALQLDVDGPDSLALRHPEGSLGVRRVLPLPGYLDGVDSSGRPVAEVVMSHADRVRLSPIVGCAYDCGFCDLPAEVYTRRDAERLLQALDIAIADPALPARHVLISGGSPRRTHYDEFIETCETVIARSPLPVDVMFSPMIDRPDMLPRLVDAGAAGFAINLEVFAEQPAIEALRGKFRTVRDEFKRTVVQAVELLGRTGRVRSLIIAGLEAPDETLAGIEYLASLGCSPVISPFRPADGTRLRSLEPPSHESLLAILAASRLIVADHGVALGPDCTACQHNTLTFPWDLVPAVSDG